MLLLRSYILKSDRRYYTIYLSIGLKTAELVIYSLINN